MLRNEIMLSALKKTTAAQSNLQQDKIIQHKMMTIHCNKGSHFYSERLLPRPFLRR